MLGLGRELELAAAPQVTGNMLLLDQRDDTLHRTFIGEVIIARALGTKTGDEPGVVLGHPSVAMPAVAP
ncbi:hypothetical protein D9M69_458020 [compost metagenome]